MRRIPHFSSEDGWGRTPDGRPGHGLVPWSCVSSIAASPPGSGRSRVRALLGVGLGVSFVPGAQAIGLVVIFAKAIVKALLVALHFSTSASSRA